MKYLLQYLKRNPLQTILAPLFKMLEAVFELLIPILVARMVDQGIRQADTACILRMGGLMVVLGIVGFASAVTAQYFSAQVAVSCGTAMRSDLFRHIQSFSWTQLDTVGTSALITRMTSDINQVQTGVNMFLRLFLRSPFIVFGAVVMAFLVDARAAIPFVIVVPLLFLVVFAIILMTIPLYRSVQERLDLLLARTRDNLRGVRVVRAFTREQDETDAFLAANDALRARQIFVGRISALLNPVTYVMVNLGIAAILWYGGRRVDSGLLTQGQVIALVNYMSQILVELIKFANLIITLSRAMASLRRVSAVFDQENPEPDETGVFPVSGIASDAYTNRPQADGASICFEHVSFTYAGARTPALQDISFSVSGGSTVGIIGATGSGKSTLANLIARFYRVSTGSIRINGTDVNSIAAEELRQHIGMVPQKASLVAGTLRDNLLWGNAAASDDTLYAALETAQAADFVREKQQGLELVIEQNGQNLSGGQKQRLTIARALTGTRPVLILDDSSSALDFATDARLRRALRERLTGTTVLLIAQRVSTVRGADRILVLDGGRMAGFGTHAELIRTCPVYQEICRSQMTDDDYAAETDTPDADPRGH